jgi:hypothetical protein
MAREAIGGDAGQARARQDQGQEDGPSESKAHTRRAARGARALAGHHSVQPFLHGRSAGRGQPRARGDIQSRGHPQQRLQLARAIGIAGQAIFNGLALAQAFQALVQNNRDLHYPLLVKGQRNER